VEIVKKHIVFTVINDLSYDQRMMRICNALAEHGYDVTIIGRRFTNSKPLIKQQYKQRRIRCVFNNGPLFYIEYQIKLFFTLLFIQCDMYAAVDWDTLLPNTMVALIKSRKLAVDAHEYFTEVPEVKDRPFIKRCWHLVAKYCLPNTILRYTVSLSLAEELERVYEIPFAIIRNVPLKKSTNTYTTEEKFIIYQGDLNPGRGIEPCIKALKHVDMKLHIAGDGPLMNTLKNLALQEGVSEKLIFWGYLNPPELHDLTSKAWLGINLLDSTSKSYYYSLSNKFFNYVQANIPQLCSKLPEYIYLNGRYQVAMFADYDAQAIIEAINNLIQHPTQYQLLKQATNQAASEWNWENEKQLLISLYDQAFAHN
jgi:glycosyltransferase involved in cell wall biosynthesis